MKQALRSSLRTATKPVLLLLALLALGQALAQQTQAQDTQAPTAQERWAVQVVALRDFREARAAADDLITLGFDAYTEFAMLDSQQWVRVRVGCFSSREAADAMATALRARITAQAQAVEFSQGAAVPGCTEEVIGFLNGYDWRLVDDSGPVQFDVTVAGVRARVAHDGRRWRVVQEDEQATPEVETVDVLETVEFRAERIAGMEFVSLTSAAGRVVVCPGELVASVGDVAIVLRGELVLACRFAGGPREVAGR